MKSNTRAVLSVSLLALLTLMAPAGAFAQAAPADYERAMGPRERWMHLTEKGLRPAGRPWRGTRRGPDHRPDRLRAAAPVRLLRAASPGSGHAGLEPARQNGAGVERSV